jgi:Uma2 family endonuclease
MATYEDFASLPEGSRVELIDGEIRYLEKMGPTDSIPPGPLPRHTNVQRVLGNIIGKPYQDDDGNGGPGGWWILLEAEILLSSSVYRADIAGWEKVRLPNPWDMRPIDITPNWICEVQSPHNAAHDRVFKRELYARHGVQFYWLVDPAERILEALQLSEKASHNAAHDRVFGENPPFSERSLKRKKEMWISLGTYDELSVARIAPFEEIEISVGKIFPPKSYAPSVPPWRRAEKKVIENEQDDKGA